MAATSIKSPGPDHPISIVPNKKRVVVRVGDRVIANSLDALTLTESSYGPVLYIPRKDVDMSLLQRTDHTSYCPYKGKASYFSLPLLGTRAANAIWSYETPYESVAEIASHLAFYADRVAITEEAT